MLFYISSYQGSGGGTFYDVRCTQESATGVFNHTNVLDLPMLYIITPTYDRPTQIPDLVRLSNTLRNVRNLHWIVVEDGLNLSNHVKSLLQDSKILYTYLSASSPSSYVKRRLKGIAQRNKALSWIRKNHQKGLDAVSYFADDDNSYTLELFSEIRKTKKISVFPVGFTGGDMTFQAPMIENGKVVGFYAWAHDIRVFAVDMAGFALNVRVLFDYQKMMFSYTTPAGMNEEYFLKQCCTVDELEPLANNCTKILVWHIRTQSPKLAKNISNIDWNVSSLIKRLKINTKIYKRNRINENILMR